MPIPTLNLSNIWRKPEICLFLFAALGISEGVLFTQGKEKQASSAKLKIKLCKIVFRMEFIGICFYAQQSFQSIALNQIMILTSMIFIVI